MNILVSCCLLGVNCKYNGNNNRQESILNLKNKYNLILVCPEQLGGLPTPRPAAEIVNEDGIRKVINKSGEDVTEQYRRGAEETLKIALEFGCKIAVLKERSPSCGSKKIYDGSFTSKLIDGDGFTAKLLEENGIKVIGESLVEMLDTL